MKFLARAVIAALTLVAAVAAQSAVIHYEGTITSAAPTVTGSVGGFGFIRQVASDVDFWSFAGIAGSRVSIRGTRLDSGLDPAFDLYFGTTTADESLFRIGQSWGGLQFLASADDEVDPPAGPFGDPLLSLFTLPSTGTYTIKMRRALPVQLVGAGRRRTRAGDVDDVAGGLRPARGLAATPRAAGRVAAETRDAPGRSGHPKVPEVDQDP